MTWPHPETQAESRCVFSWVGTQRIGSSAMETWPVSVNTGSRRFAASEMNVHPGTATQVVLSDTFNSAFAFLPAVSPQLGAGRPLSEDTGAGLRRLGGGSPVR